MATTPRKASTTRARKPRSTSKAASPFSGAALLQQLETQAQTEAAVETANQPVPVDRETLVIDNSGPAPVDFTPDAKFSDPGTEGLVALFGGLAAPAAPTVPGTTATSWSKIAGTDADFRIVAVREHAQANYETAGWDIVLETMDTAAIYAVVRKARTAKGAIQRMAAEVAPAAERRDEIVNA